MTATTPAANATGVALDVSPTATFSRAMTPGSLTTASANVRVQGSGTALAATVTYDAPTNTVTINPTANLLPGTVYTAQITTAATAADGLALASTASWNFSTARAALRRHAGADHARHRDHDDQGDRRPRDGHGRLPGARDPLLQEPR